MSIRQLRLPATIFLMVVLSYAAVGALWLTPSLIWDPDRGLVVAAMRTEAGLKLAQMRRKATSVAEIAELLGTVIAVSPVTGAIILNAEGRGIRSIGDVLPVNSGRLRSQRLIEIQASDSCCIDLYLDRLRTGLPYNLVARIDTGNFGSGPAGASKRLGVGALILILGAAISMAMLYRFIVLPLDLLRGRLTKGHAASPPRKIPPSILIRKDVIGDLARALEQSGGLGPQPTSPQGTGRDTPAGLIDEISLEVLSFDDRGGLADANSAALRLFRCQTVSQLRSMDLKVFQDEGEPGGARRSLPDLLAGGPKEGASIVVAGSEPVYRHIITGANNVDPGTAQNLVVGLLAPDHLGQTNGPGTPKANPQPSTLDRQVVKLKLLLESCLTIMDKPDSRSITTQSQPIRTDILVEDWYLEASRCGLISRQMEHDVPGQVVGHGDTVTSLIRHALTFIALRSAAEKPMLAGSGDMRGAGMVEFVFEEVDGPAIGDSDGGEGGKLHLDEAKLPLAALSRLLAVYGGKVLAIRGPDDGNLIRFAMPARPSKGQSDEAGMAKSHAKTAA